MYVLFSYYVHMKSHPYSIYFENIFMYVHACVCLYIYSNICKQKLLFWMRLIVINRLTVLVCIIHQRIVLKVIPLILFLCGFIIIAVVCGPCYTLISIIIFRAISLSLSL